MPTVLNAFLRELLMQNLNGSLLTHESDAVRSFCAAHGLEKETDMAVALARQCFPAESRIQMRVEQDPESDDFSWLVVDVAMEANGANALACYDKFVDIWSRLDNALARQLICLTFHFV